MEAGASAQEPARSRSDWRCSTQKLRPPASVSRFQKGARVLSATDDVFAAAEGVAAVGAGRGHEDDLRVARQRAHAVPR
ncbi:hypothetical protein AD428_10815 [Achromobacter sp. DMS1]|nr:hypothetical protein AD428_10815 [Achromobacter sp. DMS1]